MKIEQIYVDMDGVLADFLTGAIWLMRGGPADPILRAWSDDPDICPQLGVTMNELWFRIDCAGEAFWAGLHAFPWARFLFECCSDVAPTVVLSSPSWDPSSVSGKLLWLNKHMGKGRAFRRYLLGPPKHMVAAPGRVLIDDREKNCWLWEEHGGTAILFPSPSNRRRAEYWGDDPDPGDAVMADLERLKDA